jgi:Ran-binding protein 9/10
LKKSPLDRMPGWRETSWGYHGDDGGTFHARADAALSYDNGKYNEGDYVGCGIDISRGTAFFTRNGKRLGE